MQRQPDARRHPRADRRLLSGPGRPAAAERPQPPIARHQVARARRARENRGIAGSRPLLGAHAASPAELKQQLEADRLGKPYLLLRDATGAQRILTLPGGWQPTTVGRAPSCDVCLSWDAKVSRVHAQLQRLGDDWTVEDDGLSRNGTQVNGERLVGRHRLSDGDIMRFGRTDIAFRAPEHGVASTLIGHSLIRPVLSDAQRRVLVSLCRPYREGGAYATPATNREIAEDLVLSVEAVKTHLRTLFHRFGIEDLPQNAKRARLVELAFETGAVTQRDLER
jgi:FHA domain-containing protein